MEVCLSRAHSDNQCYRLNKPTCLYVDGSKGNYPVFTVQRVEKKNVLSSQMGIPIR